MIPWQEPNKDASLFRFHDRICDRLILMMVNGRIDSDKFYSYYHFHDGERYIRAISAFVELSTYKV